MRLTFSLYDVQEIASTASRAFISTFQYMPDKSESDLSDSDLSDFNPDTFGWGEITSEVENMVTDTWTMCAPLGEVYGTTTSKIIKKTIQTATKESQCAGLNVFKDMTPGEDRSLITTCTTVCYWCCCETVKKVSPIIAEATNNLMY